MEDLLPQCVERRILGCGRPCPPSTVKFRTLSNRSRQFVPEKKGRLCWLRRNWLDDVRDACWCLFEDITRDGRVSRTTTVNEVLLTHEGWPLNASTAWLLGPQVMLANFSPERVISILERKSGEGLRGRSQLPTSVLEIILLLVLVDGEWSIPPLWAQGAWSSLHQRQEMEPRLFSVFILVALMASQTAAQQTLPLPNPVTMSLTAVIDVASFASNQTCPGPGQTEETYRLGTESQNRTCTPGSNPPSNAANFGGGQPFWKSANNVETAFLTFDLQQVRDRVMLGPSVSHNCSQESLPCLFPEKKVRMKVDAVVWTELWTRRCLP